MLLAIVGTSIVLSAPAKIKNGTSPYNSDGHLSKQYL